MNLFVIWNQLPDYNVHHTRQSHWTVEYWSHLPKYDTSLIFMSYANTILSTTFTHYTVFKILSQTTWLWYIGYTYLHMIWVKSYVICARLRNSLLDLVLLFELFANTETSVAVWPNSRSTNRCGHHQRRKREKKHFTSFFYMLPWTSHLKFSQWSDYTLQKISKK